MRIRKTSETAPIQAQVVDNLNTDSPTDALSAKQGKELKEIIEETVLYYDENERGTNESITMTESASNFKYIEIFYCDAHNLFNSVKVHNPNGKSINLHTFHVYSNSGTVIADSSEVKINGKSIIANADQDKYGKWNSWNNSIDKTNGIYITRIVGYKQKTTH